MLPKYHILSSLIFSTLILILFPQIGFLNFLIIFFSGIFIDIDHYLYYVYRKKDFSLKNAYNWFVETEKKYYKLPKNIRKKTYRAICWLHGLEIFILLFLLSLFSNIFLFIILGFGFHRILDDIYDYIKTGEIGHSLFYSYKLIKLKKLKHIEDIR